MPSISTPPITSALTKKSSPFWHDRELRFVSPESDLELRHGEFLIGELPNVVDVKSGPDVSGTLSLTNLRLIWQRDMGASSKRKKDWSSHSIGFNCCHSLRPGGGMRLHSLDISAKFNNCRFEFTFAHSDATSNLFSIAQTIFHAYNSSKLYRDMCLRVPDLLVEEDGKHQLSSLLPGETLLVRHNNIYNVANDNSRNFGSMLVTNIRVIWFADLSPTSNISLPWIQMEDIGMMNSNDGESLICIACSQYVGSYRYRFKLVGTADESARRLERILADLAAFYFDSVLAREPILGIPRIQLLEDGVILTSTANGVKRNLLDFETSTLALPKIFFHEPTFGGKHTQNRIGIALRIEKSLNGRDSRVVSTRETIDVEKLTARNGEGTAIANEGVRIHPPSRKSNSSSAATTTSSTIHIHATRVLPLQQDQLGDDDDDDGSVVHEIAVGFVTGNTSTHPLMLELSRGLLTTANGKIARYIRDADEITKLRHAKEILTILKVSGDDGKKVEMQWIGDGGNVVTDIVEFPPREVFAGGKIFPCVKVCSYKSSLELLCVDELKENREMVENFLIKKFPQKLVLRSQLQTIFEEHAPYNLTRMLSILIHLQVSPEQYLYQLRKIYDIEDEEFND